MGPFQNMSKFSPACAVHVAKNFIFKIRGTLKVHIFLTIGKYVYCTSKNKGQKKFQIKKIFWLEKCWKHPVVNHPALIEMLIISKSYQKEFFFYFELPIAKMRTSESTVRSNLYGFRSYLGPVYNLTIERFS